MNGAYVIGDRDDLAYAQIHIVSHVKDDVRAPIDLIVEILIIPYFFPFCVPTLGGGNSVREGDLRALIKVGGRIPTGEHIALSMSIGFVLDGSVGILFRTDGIQGAATVAGEFNVVRVNCGIVVIIAGRVERRELA